MSSVKKYLRQDQPLQTDGMAIYPYSKEMENLYTYRPHFGDSVVLFKKDLEAGTISIPRALAPIGKIDKRVSGEVVLFPKQPIPRENQVEIFDETIAFLNHGLSGVVEAYTGFGKTVLGFAAAYAVQRKTLVITTKEDIYDQWLSGAKKFLGLEEHEVGEIRGDKCEVLGTKFVVAMIHSLSKDEKYPDWIVKDFGLIIFDECHRLPADQFVEVAGMFPAKLRLGLTATTKRSDGKEIIYLSHIGPIRVQTKIQLMVPKILRFKSEWTCPRTLVKKEDGSKEVVPIPHMAGKTSHVDKILAANPERNALLAELVASAYHKDRKTVFFSIFTDHLQTIKRLLVTKHGISAKDIGTYIGASTVAQKRTREREKTRPVLLTTFSMMSEGTSLDWLDTAVLGMPRSHVTQPVGRVRREYADKKDTVVMDIRDDDSPVYRGYGNSRLNWYHAIGAEIIDID